MNIFSVSFADMAKSSLQCSSTTAQFELHDCALLQQVRTPIAVRVDDLEKINWYNLEELAQFIAPSLPDERQSLFNKDNSQTSAKNIMKSQIHNPEERFNYDIDATPKIKNKSIGDIPKCYFDAKNNRGNVSVCKDNTTLVYVEVQSGKGTDSFVQATRKTILCLLSYVRLLKAFRCEDPKITAFVFPRNDVQRCVVQVNMCYIASSVTFTYSISCLKKEEVGSALASALEANKAVCQSLHTDSPPNLGHVVFLTAAEIQRNWSEERYELHKSKFGVLLMSTSKCLKKPLYTSHYKQIENLYLKNAASPGRIRHIPTYNVVGNGFFTYNKVVHDPLSHDEAKLCSYHLVQKVHEVILHLHSDGIMHCDLRLPNICFDVAYNPVLIDLEFSMDFTSTDMNLDMLMFGRELKAVFSPKGNADEFVCKFTNGTYNDRALRRSVVATGRETLQDVIRRREGQ